MNFNLSNLNKALALILTISIGAPVSAQAESISDRLGSRLGQMYQTSEIVVASSQIITRPRSEYETHAIRMARRYGIPSEIFLNLITVESNWQDNARSHVGAQGLAQLMPATAAYLGVDPRDPYQNIEGGARYLAEQFQTFGSWSLALAAYNAGPGAVRQYGGIPPYSETQNYVRAILG